MSAFEGGMASVAPREQPAPQGLRFGSRFSGFGCRARCRAPPGQSRKPWEDAVCLRLPHPTSDLERATGGQFREALLLHKV